MTSTAREFTKLYQSQLGLFDRLVKGQTTSNMIYVCTVCKNKHMYKLRRIVVNMICLSVIPEIATLLYII